MRATAGITPEPPRPHQFVILVTNPVLRRRARPEIERLQPVLPTELRTEIRRIIPTGSPPTPAGAPSPAPHQTEQSPVLVHPPASRASQRDFRFSI